MKRLIFPVFALVALLLSWTMLPSTAQQTPTTVAFKLTYAGQSSPVIPFTNTTSSCGVVVTGGGTFTLTPQSSNDGTTWVTASSVNSGSITSVGSYTGGIANTGLQAFRVVATSIDSTPVTGTLICSASLARASGGGGPTPTPFVPSTPAAGNCIAISTPPASGTISVSGAGCTPSPAPSPQVTATACAASPSVGPGPLINIPAGCSSGGGSSWTALAFSPTATGTNYNPQAQTASSYFASTTTLTPPTPPYILRITALVTATSSSNGYYGIMVSSDGTHFNDFVVQVVGTGFVSADGDCTVSACATGGYANPFPIAAHQPVYIDAIVSVYSSTFATIGGIFNGSPVCAGGVFGGATGKCAFTSSAVDLSGTLTFYAIGGASTDVVSAAYCASQSVASCS